jgi:hypothetical protein
MLNARLINPSRRAIMTPTSVAIITYLAPLLSTTFQRRVMLDSHFIIQFGKPCSEMIIWNVLFLGTPNRGRLKSEAVGIKTWCRRQPTKEYSRFCSIQWKKNLLHWIKARASFRRRASLFKQRELVFGRWWVPSVHLNQRSYETVLMNSLGDSGLDKAGFLYFVILRLLLQESSVMEKFNPRFPLIQFQVVSHFIRRPKFDPSTPLRFPCK